MGGRLKTAQYPRTLSFDLSTVGRNMAPSNPHARVATADLTAKGIAGAWTETEGEMPDGAVIIAAITSCTNTSNPRNTVAAGLPARKAGELCLTRKPWSRPHSHPAQKSLNSTSKKQVC